ncbi:hypothetical protein [Chondrinema litorale]|uniref:hypothetical protein n=1 Tax=Chondrinema litorale TaxID=2994555 RepID=UPI002542A947|nr:hypothetical protein [Chondrinema litorale]UZR97502.1 hypothetical protein OQ292_27225 [Chondrinema litorale]
MNKIYKIFLLFLILTACEQEEIEIKKTNITKEQHAKKSTGSNVLYFVGDQQITREEIDDLDFDKIETVEVIKDKDKIRKYTPKDYDGIVILHMKKEDN